MTNLQRNVKAFIEKQGGYVGAAAKLKVTAVSLQMFMLGNRCYSKTLERIGRVGKDGVLLKTSAHPIEGAKPAKAKPAKKKGGAKKKSLKAKSSKADKPKTHRSKRTSKPKAKTKAKAKSKAKPKVGEMNGVSTPAAASEPPKDETSEATAE